MLEEIQASPTTTSSLTTDSSSSDSGSSFSDIGGVGVMGGRSFADYDLADMSATAASSPPYNTLDSDSNSDRRGRDLNLDSVSDNGAGGGGSGLKASDFVFPSELSGPITPTPTPSSGTSDVGSSGSDSSDGSGSSGGSSGSGTSGMTKFQLQMSGQWNQQVVICYLSIRLIN